MKGFLHNIQFAIKYPKIIALLTLIVMLPVSLIALSQQQISKQEAAGTTSVSSTILRLTVFLHGIGKAGDAANPQSLGTSNPIHSQRIASVQMYNSSNQLVVTKTITVTFNRIAGNFIGTLDGGTSLRSGAYTVRITVNHYLSALIPGIQTIIAGTSQLLPAVILTSGDITNDNTLNILDYNILMDCYSDLTPAKSCTPQQALAADLTDDGFVNALDYNLFIRELINRSGSSNSTSAPTYAPTAMVTPTGKTIISDFPNATNTGYKHAPGYPGHLTTFIGTIQSNMTYKFMDFPNGLYLGDVNHHPTNVTFYGCRFASNAVVDANVADYGDNSTFIYSTFEPSRVSVPPVAYNTGYQYGIDQRYDGKVTVDHTDFWGWGNGIQLGYSSQAKPFTISNSWFHDARDDGGKDHTDAILENYGGQRFITINHNTIISNGNTNGLGLQGNNYNNIIVTNNYFSGFGYTVNIGGSGAGSTNLTFTGNTFGTDKKPVFGPLYGWSGKASDIWRNNKWHVVLGSYYTTLSDDGNYWWPDGTIATTDYTGQ